MKDPEIRRQARNLLKAAHMTVAYGGQPRMLTTALEPNPLDDRQRSKAVATLKEGIEEAYEPGTVGCTFRRAGTPERRRPPARS